MKEQLFWHCAHCGEHEAAHPPYDVGDSEPCTCGHGVARVMTMAECARIEQRIALGWKPPPAYRADTTASPAKEGK